MIQRPRPNRETARSRRNEIHKMQRCRGPLENAPKEPATETCWEQIRAGTGPGRAQCGHRTAAPRRGNGCGSQSTAADKNAKLGQSRSQRDWPDLGRCVGTSSTGLSRRAVESGVPSCTVFQGLSKGKPGVVANQTNQARDCSRLGARCRIVMGERSKRATSARGEDMSREAKAHAETSSCVIATHGVMGEPSDNRFVDGRRLVAQCPPGYERKRLAARKLLPIHKLRNQQELRDTGTHRHVVHAEHVERDSGSKLVAGQWPGLRWCEGRFAALRRW